MTGPRGWLLLAALRVVAVVERRHGERARAWNTGHHSAVTTRGMPLQASRERFSATPAPETGQRASGAPRGSQSREQDTTRWRDG